jgi:hypothetical protein
MVERKCKFPWLFIPEVKEDDEVTTFNNKAPNFHSNEDDLLAIAWVSATKIPIAGTAQETANFWADVHKQLRGYRRWAVITIVVETTRIY